MYKQIRFLEPFFSKAIKTWNGHFQTLLKEKWQISRQIEKSSTFQHNIQIQALFNVCGSHGINLIFDTDIE